MASSLTFGASAPSLKAFAANMGRVNPELRKELNRGLKEAADIVAVAASARAPRSARPRGKHMADTIRAYGGNGVSQVRVNATRETHEYGARGGNKSVRTSTRHLRGGRIRVERRVGYENPYRYPRIIEFGGGKIAARPFLYNTADELRPQVLEKIEKAVAGVLVKYWAQQGVK